MSSEAWQILRSTHNGVCIFLTLAPNTFILLISLKKIVAPS